MDSENLSLEEAARRRKERIEALKRKAQRPSSSSETEPSTKKGPLPRAVFRSYKPTDNTLKETILPTVKIPEAIEQVKEQLAAAKPEPLLNEVDLANLAPRKQDWDLKRDVAKKLEKLERRTQRAIAELIRDRLKEGEVDLADAVNNARFDTNEDD